MRILYSIYKNIFSPRNDSEVQMPKELLLQKHKNVNVIKCIQRGDLGDNKQF